MQSGSKVCKSRERTERLSALFLQRLREIAAVRYAPFLSDETMRQEEVEEEVQAYFSRKKSGLQDVYSYYGEQWDYFYRMETASDAAFLPMLQQVRSLFARLYQPAELDASYYMEELKRYAYADERRQLLRRHFMQKWQTLLEQREWDYQTRHIERLCDDYFRICQEHGSMIQNQGRGSGGMGARLSWLQLTCSPELRKELRRLAVVMRKSSVIKELERVLGRKQADKERHYQAVAGQLPVWLLRPASHSDIVGITEGDNLNALMPLEYCLLAEPALEPLFYRRYTEKKLSVFESVSRRLEHVEASVRQGREMEKRLHRGPFVVCVDTSASMQGERELLAKAIVLSLALMSDRLKRNCRVVLFSDHIETVELKNLYTDLSQLTDFFCHTFHGGSDMSPALSDSAQTLEREDFCYADLLWLSDFEMSPMTSAQRYLIEELKRRSVRVYAVAFGGKAESSYLEMADRCWLVD